MTGIFKFFQKDDNIYHRKIIIEKTEKFDLQKELIEVINKMANKIHKESIKTEVNYIKRTNTQFFPELKLQSNWNYDVYDRRILIEKTNYHFKIFKNVKKT